MILYICQFVTLLLLTMVLVWYFSHSLTPIYVRILAFTSFLFTFTCFLLLPIDIYETGIKSQTYNLRLAWTIIYDVSFFLCWVFLPLVQEYEDSGQFTVGNKLKSALKMNGILIAVILTGALILIVYLIMVGQFSMLQLPNIFAFIVNMFGMCLVSIILGYGFVSLPKEHYRNIFYKRRVEKYHKLAEQLRAQQQQIMEEVIEIRDIVERREKFADSMTDGHESTVLALISNQWDFSNFRSLADPNPKLPKQTNASLHTIIKKRVVQHDACEHELDELAQSLKSVTQSVQNNNYKYKKLFYILMTFLNITISIIIFWAEFSTFISVFNQVNILSLVNWASPAAYLLNAALTLYIVYVAAHTVFSIKLYRIFSLHRKNSSASSLCFTCINLARISFPLCYNYLQITDMPDAQFLDFFGDITYSSKVSLLFPVLMIFFGACSLFDVYNKIMGYLGFSSYAFDEEEELEKFEEGQKILTDKLKEKNMEGTKMGMIQLL